MKSGSVSKADAVLTGDEGMICGVLDSSNGGPNQVSSNLLDLNFYLFFLN